MARKTKAEAQATRDSLIDAAEQLFQRQGVSRTSLQDIAEAAGVTRGAVYWHFEDKSALFNAMMERVRLPMEEVPADAPQRDAQALARLRGLLLRPLRRAVDDAQVRRVLEIALHKVEYVDELATVRARHLAAIRDFRGLIDRSLRQAGVSPARAARHAGALHALVAGLLHTWLLAEQAHDLLTEAEPAIDTYLAGIRAGLPAAR
jgi:TetR/AcrR family transcriptional regulator, acrAB operon repressor